MHGERGLPYLTIRRKETGSMHDHQQQNEPDWGGPVKDMKETMNFTVGLAQMFAFPMSALWTRPGTTGDRYFTGRAAIGLILMAVCIALGMGEYDGHIALAAFFLVLFVLAVHKAKRNKLQQEGQHVHSRFWGVSWCKGNEYTAKNTEASLTILWGFLCLSFSIGLGAWMIAAGVGMAISVGVTKMEQGARARSMRDARWEQELIVMEEMRQNKN